MPSQGKQEQRPIDLVLVGAGQTNVQVIRFLKKTKGVNVVLISEHTSCYYPGMLPGMLTDMYTENDLQVSLKTLTQYGGAKFILGRAMSIDSVRNEVIVMPVEPYSPKSSPAPNATQNGEFPNASPTPSDDAAHPPQAGTSSDPPSGEIRVHFDIVSINVGSQTKASKAVPGVEENACTTRPLFRLMKKIENFENGYFLSPGKEKPTQVRICTVGAGMAGVELAAALEYRFQKKFGAKVISTIVSHLPLESTMRCIKLGQKVHQRLLSRGFTCLFGKKVARVDPNHVVFSDNTELDFDLMIWACGAEPPAFLRQIGEIGFAELDPEKDGYLKVAPTLQSLSRLDTFGAGDCVSMPEHPGLAKAGVMAVKEGPILCHNLLLCVKALQAAMSKLSSQTDEIETEEWKQLKKEALERCSQRLKRFKPKSDTLKLLNMSDGTAIGGYKRHSFEGKFALKLKDRLDRGWMSTFRDCGLGCSDC